MKTRLAKTEEAKKIMLFIKKHWSKKHILANDHNLFLNFYKKNSKNLNIIICIKKTSIISILGFVDYSQYNKIPKSSVWLALWFTSYKYPASGILVLNYLCKKFNNRNIYGLGLTSNALMILEKYGFKLGVMNHYFKLNDNFKNKFKIIKNYDYKPIKNKKYFYKEKIFDYSLVKHKDLKKINFLSKYEKNFDYIKSKFLNNKYYNYKLFSLSFRLKTQLIIIIRKIKVKNSNILRIVDIIGNTKNFKYTGQFFELILSKENAEYIDCLNFGIADRQFTGSGFLKLDYKSKLIVPNYFEPFISKNKIINYAYQINNKNNKKININKADGDQERPNKLLN